MILNSEVVPAQDSSSHLSKKELIYRDSVGATPLCHVDVG